MSIASCGSRLPVGSSARMSAGSPTMARAIATRCCSPPERTLRRIAAAPGEADALERLADARANQPRGRPSTSSVIATLSKTVQLPTSLKSWNTKPMLRRSAGIELS